MATNKALRMILLERAIMKLSRTFGAFILLANATIPVNARFLELLTSPPFGYED